MLTFKSIFHHLPTESSCYGSTCLHRGAAVDFNQPGIVVTTDHEVGSIQLKRILKSTVASHYSQSLTECIIKLSFRQNGNWGEPE